MITLNKSKNNKVLFVVDTDVNHGLGHLQRIIKFSEIFKNFEKTILTNKSIKLKSFRNINFKKFKSEDHIYQFTVIDNYKINYEDEKKIKKKSLNLITIDDLSNRKYCADYIINYNPYAKKTDYKNKVSNETVLLLGKEYNFLNIKNSKKDTKIKKKLDVFIYFGQNNRTSLIKKDILPYLNNGINKIYISSKYKFKKKNYNLIFRTFDNYKKTINLMKKCDVLIVSSGIIIYEAISLEKLIFSKSISDNQSSHFNYLKENTYINDIKRLNELNLLKNKFNTVETKKFFKNYSTIELLKTVFFGLKNKNNYHISLFNYKKQFLSDLYKMQTPENRKFFKNKYLFSFKHHKKYIEEFFKNSDNFILIIKRNFNEIVGYVKFEQKNKKKFISIIIKDDYKNQSIAKNVLGFINSKNFSDTKFYAEIKKNNVYSVSAFKKAGFIINKNLKFLR